MITKDLINFKKEMTEIGPVIVAQLICEIKMGVSDRYVKDLKEESEFWKYSKEILTNKLETFIFGEIMNELHELRKLIWDLSLNSNPLGTIISYQVFQKLYEIIDNLKIQDKK